MTRKTAEKRVERMVACCDEQTKINARFDIQRTFGPYDSISHDDYAHLVERIDMQIIAFEGHQYATKSGAVRAMWRYINTLKRDGVHTGALSGDEGTAAQWITNDGHTAHATVDHDNGYYLQDRRWHVNIW
jgi:hypothetical protein